MSYVKLSLFCLFCLAGLVSRADTLDTRLGSFEKPLRLTPWVKVFEDSSERLPVQQIAAHPDWFTAPEILHRKSATDIYWAETTIDNREGPERSLILFFSNLSFVDLYVWSGDSVLFSRKAGTFRPAKEIRDGDAREYFSLDLPAGKVYTLYLRVHHTKHYWPALDFYCQDARVFQSELRHRQMMDLGVLGAISIFLIYSLISYFISFYRLYIWLSLYIAASGLYALSMKGYFIDWFTPENPAMGWLWNIHLIHIAMIGGLLLVTEFWKVKEHWPLLHRLFIILVGGLITVSVLSFGIDFFTSNYNLMNTINLWYLGCFAISAFYGLMIVWSGLSRPGRIVGYGYIVYLLGYIICIVLFAIMREKAIALTSLLVNFATLMVIMLFSTALKEELHQHETDKNRALLQLNELQQRQNQDLERLIQARTWDLQERNERIETLMQELHHRVKNNLQLLYGLIRLQLPDVRDPSAKDALQNNLNRIRAMSIVNEKLFLVGDASIVNLHDFAHETAHYVSAMYSDVGKVDLQMSLMPDITVPVNFAVPFGLILTELLTNSFKHAVQGNDRPVICMSVAVSEGQLEFRYNDNGNGQCPPGTVKKEFSGLTLVKDLVRQLHGKMDTWNEGGLYYKFLMPV